MSKDKHRGIFFKIRWCGLFCSFSFKSVSEHARFWELGNITSIFVGFKLKAKLVSSGLNKSDLKSSKSHFRKLGFTPDDKYAKAIKFFFAVNSTFTQTRLFGSKIVRPLQEESFCTFLFNLSFLLIQRVLTLQDIHIGTLLLTGSYVVSQDIYWFQTIYGKCLHKRTNQRSKNYMRRGGHQ